MRLSSPAQAVVVRACLQTLPTAILARKKANVDRATGFQSGCGAIYFTE
jgi:hypothetical protein